MQFKAIKHQTLKKVPSCFVRSIVTFILNNKPYQATMDEADLPYYNDRFYDVNSEEADIQHMYVSFNSYVIVKITNSSKYGANAALCARRSTTAPRKQ
jgi:hypothetical protein